tara:strand:- start:7374 stop:8021 length:648 start_codon:yes stop_codon:yes gene_type:complete
MASDFLKQFFTITGHNLPNPHTLETPDKVALAQHLKSAGESAKSIALYFGCHPSYIYQLLKKARNERLGELECQTFKEHFLETVIELETDIEMYQKVQAGLRSGYKVEEVDGEGNKVEVNKKGSIRDFKDVGSLIFSLQKELISLKKHVGIIPSANQGDLNTSLHSSNPENVNEELSLKEQNPEDVKALLMSKLSQRNPTLQESILKKIGDENIL